MRPDHSLFLNMLENIEIILTVFEFLNYLQTNLNMYEIQERLFERILRRFKMKMAYLSKNRFSL